MIQVVLKALKIFCSFGGPYVAPFIIPSIAPVCISTLLPSVCIISMFFINFPEAIEKDKKKKMGITLGIYYLIALLIACCAMQTACKARNRIPM